VPDCICCFDWLLQLQVEEEMPLANRPKGFDPDELTDGPAAKADEVLGESVNLTNSTVEKVQAELVRVNQSNVSHIIANEVEFRQGAVNRIEAQKVDFDSGAVLMVEADTFTLSDGTVIAARGNNLIVNDGSVTTLYSGTAELHNAKAGLLAARHVKGENLQTTILVTGKVDGQVTAVLDTPRAVLAGLVAGIAAGMVIFAGKLLTKSGDR